MCNDLGGLTKKLIAFRDARNWKQFHSAKNLCVSVALEASELLELTQWKSDEDFGTWAADHRFMIGQECADILSYILLLTDELGIDLGRAVCEKIELNEDRYPVSASRGVATKYDKLLDRDDG